MGEKNFEQIKKEIKSMISEIIEVSESKLTEDARFVEDLDVDSMRALEIVASIEKKYKVAIPEDQIRTLRSLKNIYDLLEKSIKK
ncbi:MAG: hypothetical protein AMJ78_00295 [Omnitrophica WOR_2 bacterium SM23_29]|nr:MAG: hypothetical protein AMJ78_00295 [Omnitrophica WOR_2 bacterium SM23_29]